jgi:hypothetical protein
MGPENHHSTRPVCSTHIEYSSFDVLGGSYLMSLVMKKIFMLKCNLNMLRLTVMLTLLAFPLVLTRLLSFHQRVRPPPSIMTPTPDAIVLAAFPLAWFYGFLYYTDLPSLLFVVATVAEATASRHWRASLVRDAFLHSHRPSSPLTKGMCFVNKLIVSPA